MENDKLSILDVCGAYGQKECETFKRSRTPWRVKPEHGRRMSFSSIYANYADIFNHRSMEKDKLFVLDVCGAYGQKDIKK